MKVFWATVAISVAMTNGSMGRASLKISVWVILTGEAMEDGGKYTLSSREVSAALMQEWTGSRSRINRMRKNRSSGPWPKPDSGGKRARAGLDPDLLSLSGSSLLRFKSL